MARKPEGPIVIDESVARRISELARDRGKSVPKQKVSRMCTSQGEEGLQRAIISR